MTLSFAEDLGHYPLEGGAAATPQTGGLAELDPGKA